MSTLIQADLTGDIGIIVFSNTSPGGADQRWFAEINDAVWDEANRLRLNFKQSTRPAN